MQDSKKAIMCTITIITLTISLSLSFLFVASSYTHNYDWQLREELAGSIDTLIVGASHGQCALYTREIDKVTGSNSYNLSYDSQKNYEKKYLLEKELARNDIKTVVLELSYDTLQSSDTTIYTNANIFSIMRMDSFSDRIAYFINNVNLNNKLYVYSEIMCKGLYGLLKGKEGIDEKQYDLKGSRLIDGKDYSLKEDEILENYNKNHFSVTTFNTKTVNGFTDLIKLCKNHNVRVLVTVVPVSDNYLWCIDNLDEFNEWAIDYCKKNDVEFYDFNLLKNRYSLFSDVNCYSTDTHHMSEKGSKIFSRVFAETVKKVSYGNDVSNLFYSSFDEMKKDSPYYKVMKEK